MRLFSMAILLVLFAAMGVNADAAQASQKQCHSNCVEVAQKPNGYTIKVRDGSGAVTYNQTIQSDARNPGPLVTEVIDTAGAVVPEADTTQTTTEAHPLPGGGSVIIITVRVNGVIVSTTVITVDRFGKVIEVTDV